VRGPLDVVLRIEGLNKRFPHVWANRDISLDVRRAEIHCLLGENGAGKTTLAECLYGTYRPDSGQVTFKGEPLSLSSPRDAIRAGIGMVHQHFVLAPALSVVENVIAGTPTRFIVDQRQEEKRLAKLCKDYGLDLDLRAAISHLSVGEQQWVEILKALYLGVDLLILDEPTAVLTPMETDRLFAIVERMKADGLSVIFITHRLDEVMRLSDRVTVLRRGQVMDTVETSQVDKAELARMMVGRDVVFLVEKEPLESGSPLLELRDIRVRGDRGQEALRGISFSVREREILGVAGVSGNGQRELFEVLVGVRMPSEGRVLLNGADITYRSPRYRMARGIATIPEDRIAEGLVADFTVEENLVLGFHRTRPYSKRLFWNGSAIESFAMESIRTFGIATPSPRQVTRVLSGGNLQKVILARELSRSPTCLIASQPTRGLDVGATEYVRGRLLEQRKRGAAIVLISEDLEEIFNLSDRIAVLSKGQIAGMLDANDASLETVGRLMAGMEGAAVQESS
jgi:ABC-type uncharacterized transport system ATPase subunit